MQIQVRIRVPFRYSLQHLLPELSQCDSHVCDFPLRDFCLKRTLQERLQLTQRFVLFVVEPGPDHYAVFRLL